MSNIPLTVHPPVFLPCIMGPTGAGKTAASLALAEVLEVSVVNADSRQIYRDFPIITAQPSVEERSHCPHFLYGYLSTEQSLGAGEYSRTARNVLDEQYFAGKVPVLVGGTGLYFKSLLQGIAPIPDIPEDISSGWQTRCREEGSNRLHQLLSSIDPQYASKIHPNDRQRITRALEVHEATGKTFTWWHSLPLSLPPYKPCKIGITLPMHTLEKLLERRIDSMLEQGALGEGAKAREICDNPDAPGWSGIGCSEIYRYLDGGLTLDACKALWLKNTRAYAKRQNTWFRADKDIVWFAPDNVREITEYVLRERTRLQGCNE